MPFPPDVNETKKLILTITIMYLKHVAIFGQFRQILYQNIYCANVRKHSGSLLSFRCFNALLLQILMCSLRAITAWYKKRFSSQNKSNQKQHLVIYHIWPSDFNSIPQTVSAVFLFSLCHVNNFACC